MITAQPTARAPMSIGVLDRPGLDALAAEWPALLARTDHDAPFHTLPFIACWLDAFAPDAPLRAVVARDEIGLRAALILVERDERIYGISVRKLAGAANVHSARFDLIAHPDDAEAIAGIWAAVAELEWDVLELPDVPEGGAARGLLAAAEVAGLPVGLWESMRTPYVPLGPRDDVFGKLSPKFRSNLRRRRRKLASHGPVSLERVTAGPELDARLEEGLALEASGWKGREGTAILRDAATHAFYVSLAHASAAEGALALYFLRCGARPAAFHFTLVHAGVCYLPKLGFEESLAFASPGQLILEDVLGDCCDRGLREFDFLGPDMPWKSEWAEQKRVHHWCFAFRDTVRGRALHAAKFKLAPKLKEVWPWKP